MACLVSFGDGQNKTQSPLVSLPSRDPDSRDSAGSKKQEEESAESESETEESSSEEEQEESTFVQYDAEPLSKSRTQSRSSRSTMPGVVDVQRPNQTSSTIPPSPLESNVTTVSHANQIPPAVSAVGKVSASPLRTNAEPAYVGKSPTSSNYTGRSEESELKPLVTVVPDRSSTSLTVSLLPSPVVTTESIYAGKSPTSPAVQYSAPSSGLDYAGKVQRPPSAYSPVASIEPGFASKFQTSPPRGSPPVTSTVPTYAGKSPRSPNYAGALPPSQMQYADFDSEPMPRSRRNIPYVDDDDDDLPVTALPGSPRKPSTSSVKTSTASVMPAPPVTPLVSESSFVSTFEPATVVAPRAATGPVLVPPTARVEASPVLRVNLSSAQPTTSRDIRHTSEMTSGRVRPPSIGRMSPQPVNLSAETSADAVSQLFMKLENSYANSPTSSVRGQEPSYGPGYRPSVHGAVVRQQEPYPVEVRQRPLSARWI